MDGCERCGDYNLYEFEKWIEEQQKKHESYSKLCDTFDDDDEIQQHYRLGYKIALKDMLRHFNWM